MLRIIRDSILSASPEGQEIIRLYYQWSPLLTKLVERNEELRKEFQEVIAGVLLHLMP